MNSTHTPLYQGGEWTTPLLDTITGEIRRIADEELGLDYYPMQIRIITAEQMLDAYAMNGMPINYAHWSFGKQFLMNERSYKRGTMGLAYEIVINTNPCLVYCMEENSMTMQGLVIAHAGFGHNSFFKCNQNFTNWTDASSIIDYLKFCRDYVADCEGRYGEEEVQRFLTSCHAWSHYGVDRYKRYVLSPKEEKERAKAREQEILQNLNTIWRTFDMPAPQGNAEEECFPKEPEENILYFIEKNAPLLPAWKREIIRIVRKQAQYFYPQILTKVMNEGWATFVHYYIMTRLYEKRLITVGAYEEFLRSHTNVIFQPDFDDRRFRGMGLNPYWLGFNMFMDMKRICEHPTDEDRKWFPDIAGTPWLPTLRFAMESYRDESFIRQFLSPKLIRDARLFLIVDDEMDDELVVGAVHNEDGYRDVRSALADMYDPGYLIPNLQVVKVDRANTRKLFVEHHSTRDRRLYAKAVEESLPHLRELWGFPVSLCTTDDDGAPTDAWVVGQDGVVEYDDTSMLIR